MPEAPSRPIGGDFAIEAWRLTGPSGPLNPVCYESGRDAFRAIMRTELGAAGGDVWLPEYICGSVELAVRREGFRPRYYPLTESLAIPDEALSSLPRKKGAVILIVDYFGLQDLSECVVRIRSLSEAAIVVDKVQAYYEPRSFGADYCFTGYRKFLPVPEGAYVESDRGGLPIPVSSSGAGYVKALGCVLKGLAEDGRMPDSRYLQVLRRGEELFDSDSSLHAMSELGQALMSSMDVEASRLSRAANAAFVVDGLKAIGLEPLLALPQGAAPLAIPVALADRDEIRRRLKDQRIYLPVHWPDSSQGKMSRYLMDHELSLVVDQRYGKDDMLRMIDALGRLRARNSQDAP